MNVSRTEPTDTIDTAWIQDHLDDPAVRLVEIDVSSAAYDEGHIPGAVFWDAYADLRDSAYRPVGRGELQDLVSGSGATADTTLAFYGYGASLGYWLMKAHGHPEVRFVDGSREQWSRSGGAWSEKVPDPAKEAYRLGSERRDLIASRQDVEAAIGDPDQLVVDVRSEEEYRGERFWPSGATHDAGRAGHVPGAVNVPIGLLRNEDDALKGAEDLRKAFEAAGVTKDKALITYCTISNRATQAWFALTGLLGYPNVRVYYGSWVEWGKEPDTQIEAPA